MSVFYGNFFNRKPGILFTSIDSSIIIRDKRPFMMIEKIWFEDHNEIIIWNILIRSTWPIFWNKQLQSLWFFE